MTDGKYYIFVKVPGGREIKEYKTLFFAEMAARRSYDKKVYVVNDYNNLIPVED